MIVATFAAGLSLSLAAYAPSAPVQSEAGPRVAAMVKRYQNKLCANGTIAWTVKSQRDSLRVVTDFQYMRPNRIYVHQRQLGGSNKVGEIVCNGRVVMYRVKSLGSSNTTRQMEPVLEQRTGRLLTIDEMYILGAPGLVDNNAPLDIVMGRPDNIEHFDKLLTGLRIVGTETVNGKECTIVTGTMRATYTSPPAIEFTLAISSTNDLVQMKTLENHMGDNKQVIPIEMTWDVNVTVNDETKIKTELFQLPR